MGLVNTARYYITRAFQKPWLILPFLKKKVKDPYLKYRTWEESRGLRNQFDLLEEFRSKEEYLLIVLDACRYDALNQVADDYFDAEVEKVKGGARNTFEWGKNLWPEGPYDVRYLSGAAPINSLEREERGKELTTLYDRYVPSEHITDIRDVFQEIWTEGEIPPEEMTEIALEESKDRMVVHYYQPHAPFVGEKKTEDFLDESLGEKDHDLDAKMWKKVEEGKISDAELWELYVSNLRRALESVKELIEKTDYENIVITADHGEALGEYGIYGHPKHVDHPKVRVVPWMRLR